ncbi:MAG: GAF domain-containing protein [Deltaproteobacteria bacterium]|jgi:GAF domain-containing protein|nr:GAF domain-containing protein [Deltaproteobacteria bacterium]
MSPVDYLTPFVEVGRTIFDGAGNDRVMNLTAEAVIKTLDLKGCFIKMKAYKGEHIEVLGSKGLSERFLFGKSDYASNWVCYNLPKSTFCVPNLDDFDIQGEKALMTVEGIQAFAVLPIEIRHEIVAMVALFSEVPREFTKAELSFVEILVGQSIHSILWQRRVHSMVEKEREYLRSFQEISGAINASLNISKVLELVVTKITTVLGVKGCVVRLLDPKSQNLYAARSHGLSEEFLQKGPIDAQRSMAENLAGKVVVIDDVFTDPRLQYPAEMVEEGVRRLLSIPLMVRGKFIGVLRIYSGEGPKFTKREIDFAIAIGQQCAFAIENARIYQRLHYEYQQLLIDFGYEGSSE